MKNTYEVDISRYVNQAPQDLDINFRLKSKKLEEIADAVMDRPFFDNFTVLDTGYKNTHNAIQSIKNINDVVPHQTTKSRELLFDVLKGAVLKESYTDINSFTFKAKLNIEVLKHFNTDKDKPLQPSTIRDLMNYSTVEIYKKNPGEITFRGIVNSIKIDNLENQDVIFTFSANGVESSIFNKAVLLPDLSTPKFNLTYRRNLFKTKMAKYVKFHAGFDINQYDLPYFSKSDNIWDILHQFAIYNKATMVISYDTQHVRGFEVNFNKKSLTEVIQPSASTDINNFEQQMIGNKLGNPTVTETKDDLFTSVSENLSAFKMKSKLTLEVREGKIIMPKQNVFYFKGLGGVICDWDAGDRNNLTNFTTVTIWNGFIEALVGWYTTDNATNTTSIRNGYKKINRNQEFDMYWAEKTVDMDANYMDLIQSMKEQKQKSDSLELTFRNFVYNTKYNFNIGENYFIKMKNRRKNEQPLAINVEPLTVVDRTTTFNANSLSEGIDVKVQLSSNFTEKWIEIFKSKAKQTKWGTLDFNFNVKTDWVYNPVSGDNSVIGLPGNVKNLAEGLKATNFYRVQPDWTTYLHTRPIRDGEWENGVRIEYDYIEHFNESCWVGVKGWKNGYGLNNMTIDYYNSNNNDANYSRRYNINHEDFIKSMGVDGRGFYENGLTEEDFQSYGLVLNETGFSIIKVLKEFILYTDEGSGKSTQTNWNTFGRYSQDKPQQLHGLSTDTKVEDIAQWKQEDKDLAHTSYHNNNHLAVNTRNIGICSVEGKLAFREADMDEMYDRSKNYNSTPIVFTYSKKWPTLEEFKKIEENSGGGKWTTEKQTNKYMLNIRMLDDDMKRWDKHISNSYWMVTGAAPKRTINLQNRLGHLFTRDAPNGITYKIHGEENKFIKSFLYYPHHKEFKHGVLKKLTDNYYYSLINAATDNTAYVNDDSHPGQIWYHWLSQDGGNAKYTPINEIHYTAEGLQLIGMHNFAGNGGANYTLLKRTNNKYSKGSNRVSCLVSSFRTEQDFSNTPYNELPQESTIYTLTLNEEQLFTEIKVGNIEKPDIIDWLIWQYQNNLTNIVRYGKEKTDDYTQEDSFGFGDKEGIWSVCYYSLDELHPMKWHAQTSMDGKENTEWTAPLWCIPRSYAKGTTYQAKRMNLNTIDGKMSKLQEIPNEFINKYYQDHGSGICFDFSTFLYAHPAFITYLFAIETAQYLRPSYYINKLVDKNAYSHEDFIHWTNWSESDEYYNMHYGFNEWLDLSKGGYYETFWKFGLSAMSRHYSFLNDNMCVFTNEARKGMVDSVLTLNPNYNDAMAMLSLENGKYIKLSGFGGKVYGLLNQSFLQLDEQKRFGHFEFLDNSIMKDFVSYRFPSGVDSHEIDLSLCNTVKITYDWIYEDGQTTQGANNLTKYLQGTQSLSDFSISIDCGTISMDKFGYNSLIKIKEVSFIYYGTEWKITLPEPYIYDIEDLVHFRFTYSLSPIETHSVPNLNWLTAQNTIFGHRISGTKYGVEALGYKNGKKINTSFNTVSKDFNYAHQNTNNSKSITKDFSNINLDSVRDDNIHANILQGITLRLEGIHLSDSLVNTAPNLPSNRSNILDSEVIGKDIWSKKGNKIIRLQSYVFVEE